MINRRTALRLACATIGGAMLPLGYVPRVRAAVPDTMPKRIVSVGGAVTETLYALGLGDHIAAADTTSTYPSATHALPKVGYLRQLSAEGVLAMQPDLILLARESGPAAAIEQLTTSGVPLTVIDTERTPEGVAGLVEAVGHATGATEAPALATQIRDQFQALSAALPHGQDQTVLLLLSAGTGPLLGAGTDTAAEAIIKLAGGRVALPDMKGYKAVSLEPVLAADPDWIVMPSHVAAALGGPEGIASLDIVARTRAGSEGRIAIIDSLYLLGFGPRSAQAAADLASLLYPAVDIPALGRAASPSPLVSTMVPG